MELGDPSDSDSDFIDNTELNAKINASLGIWHGMVAKAVPERYESEQTIVANGASSYALPSDHYQTVGVDYGITSSDRIPLRRAMVQERTAYTFSASSSAEAYRLKGATIVLLPPPSTGTYYHVYITAASVLSSDADAIDGVNGWEQWIVLDVAVQMLLKRGDDVAALLAKQNEIKMEMEAAASDREVTPTRVVDTRTGKSQVRDPDFWFYP